MGSTELTDVLGSCPHCGESIQTDRLLGRTEKRGQWPLIFAECPVCVEIVHPL